MTKKIKDNFTKINIVFILSILLILSSYVPYVNLLVSDAWYWIAFLLINLFIFRPSTKKVLFVGIVLFFASMPWVMAGSRVGSEIFGVLTFTCMLYAISREILILRKSL